DAPPDGRRLLALAGLGEVGEDQADDQRRLEALSQCDDECAQSVIRWGTLNSDRIGQATSLGKPNRSRIPVFLRRGGGAGSIRDSRQMEPVGMGGVAGALARRPAEQRLEVLD